MTQLSPDDMAQLPFDKAVVFSWTPTENVALYELQVQDLQGNMVVNAILLGGAVSYQAPSWLGDKAAGEVLRWKVIAFGATGVKLTETDWRGLKFGTHKAAR